MIVELRRRLVSKGVKTMLEALDFKKAKRVIIMSTTNIEIAIDIKETVDIFPSKEGLTIFFYKPKNEAKTKDVKLKQVEIKSIHYFPMANIREIAIHF